MGTLQESWKEAHELQILKKSLIFTLCTIGIHEVRN